jgi:hypothetical protein
VEHYHCWSWFFNLRVENEDEKIQKTRIKNEAWQAPQLLPRRLTLRVCTHRHPIAKTWAGAWCRPVPRTQHCDGGQAKCKQRAQTEIDAALARLQFWAIFLGALIRSAGANTRTGVSAK